MNIQQIRSEEKQIREQLKIFFRTSVVVEVMVEAAVGLMETAEIEADLHLTVAAMRKRLYRLMTDICAICALCLPDFELNWH